MQKSPSAVQVARHCGGKPCTAAAVHLYRAYFRACRAEPCLAIRVERGASMAVTRGSQGASFDKALDVCSPTTKNIIIRNKGVATVYIDGRPNRSKRQNRMTRGLVT